MPRAEEQRMQFASITADQLTKIILAGAITIDRKSTRLNSSHSQISYAVFCLKKKIAERERHAELLERLGAAYLADRAGRELGRPDRAARHAVDDARRARPGPDDEVVCAVPVVDYERERGHLGTVGQRRVGGETDRRLNDHTAVEDRGPPLPQLVVVRAQRDVGSTLAVPVFFF